MVQPVVELVFSLNGIGWVLECQPIFEESSYEPDRHICNLSIAQIGNYLFLLFLLDKKRYELPALFSWSLFQNSSFHLNL